MKKGQTTTLKINTQTAISFTVAMLFAMAATMVLAVALLSAKAKADNTQTVNANPGFSVPQGYVLVPANSNGVCPQPAGATANTEGVHKAVAAVAPYYYNNVVTQTINDYSVDKSHNVNNSNNSGNHHEHNNYHEHDNNNDNDHGHIHNVNNGSHNGQSGDTNINNEVENVRRHAKSS